MTEREGLTLDLSRIAAELKLKVPQVAAVVKLLDEGNTVPFITRYRKEQTGNLDEVQIRAIEELMGRFREVSERAATILKSIESQGKLTPELRREIERADTIKRLEDLYLPFRPKRKTRASTARDKGLEPLANAIWEASPAIQNLDAFARRYLNNELGVSSPEEALQGAADIIAERLSEDAAVREDCRKIAWQSGSLQTSATKAAAEQGQEFRDYFDYEESVGRLPPHRILAINRGETQEMLKVGFDCDEDRATAATIRRQNWERHRFADFLQKTAADSIKRLIVPSLDREIRRELTERAEQHAVEVFARNLRSLLLQPPARGRRILAIDPGFRTGCKLAALDEQGACLEIDVIFPTGSAAQRSAAAERIVQLVGKHRCQIVAIGNGTACRETEEFLSGLISERLADLRYLIVNEAGASIYSASAAGREEFPELDATARGTISIGRRLLDPLSELVKIEPQHIGVGMYQHDVDAKRLTESLDRVVESCVNFVGVDLNTASAALLKHVSGLNQSTARKIVEHRAKHGPFRTRRQLKEVTGIGDVTFVQAAGFLKIPDGDEPLDATWIHPESYGAARKLLKRLGVDPSIVSRTTPPGTTSPFEKLEPEKVAAELEIGLSTLNDMVETLQRPGRDPRGELTGAVFKQGVLQLEDLTPGMELQGTVLNVVDFGAFVDIGVKQSGLVHISRLANRFVKSPHEVVAVGDVVTVWVMEIDRERGRVSLTMVNPQTASHR